MFVTGAAVPKGAHCRAGDASHPVPRVRSVCEASLLWPRSLPVAHLFAAVVTKAWGWGHARGQHDVNPTPLGKASAFAPQALYFTWCDRLAGSFRDTHRLIPGDAEKKVA